MKFALRLLPLFIFAALALPVASALHAADPGPLDSLQSGFVAPPDSTRPTVRWWWFGPAVVKPQLEREMNFMKQGGFGGFEVQPTYPLALDGQYPGLVNLKFLSPEFFDMLGFTAAKAKEIGLRMNLTLGSGWPYGGPMFTRDEAAQSIRAAGSVNVTLGQTSVTPPAGGGARGGRGGNVSGPIVAALLGTVTDAAPGASSYISLPVSNGAAQLPPDLHGASQVSFFTYAQAGLMQVKRPAYGAEGFVVDHYSSTSVAKFIKDIAQPEVTACGPYPPVDVFCDSLEIAGEGWTPNFLAEFKQRRGYDLTPLLPALFDNSFPQASEVRADYGKTVAEVFNDNFVKTFTQFAHDNHSLFRIQAYGTPPTTLTTYADADEDEGEYYGWKTFSGTRWASSASHLLGRPVASSETFTWLHSPVFMAAPLDIKAESNLDFLNGINQILCHGWPYTAPGVEYPGWRFYAAAVFNEKNPWWIVMPDVTTYLARASYMLRQGQPANDVALYLPEEDAFAKVTPGSLQIAGASSGILNTMVGRVVSPIIESGYDLDFVDDGVLATHGASTDGKLVFGNVKYPVVILPNVVRIPLATYKKFQDFANGGGILIALGSPPSMAPGYLATAADHQAIKDISQSLFSGPTAKGLVISEDALAQTLQSKLRPDVTYAKAEPYLGFVHRHTSAGEVYFLANTSNSTISDTAILRVDGLQPEWWNPVTGVVTPAIVAQKYAGATAIAVTLAPYDAQFLVFTSQRTMAAAPVNSSGVIADLSQGWDVTFKNASPEADPAPAHFDALHSWADDAATQYFSGVATYTKQFTLTSGQLAPGAPICVDFGPGQPATVAGGTQGMRANFQPPVGDAAVVYVNGQRAGAVWCPPYTVDVTKFLKAGANEIRIAVANRATNYMADLQHHPLPDYSALNANRTYGGNRFGAQDMNRIEVLPSGLLGSVRLVSGNPGS
jgi:hypothetical protein